MNRLLALSCLVALFACRSAGEASRSEAVAETPAKTEAVAEAPAKPEVRYYVIADT